MWFLKYRVIFFFVIFFLILSFLIKGYFSTAVKEYIKYDCTNRLNEIILTSVNDQVVSTLENESLMHVTYNDNNEVVYAYIDTKKTNEILTKTAQSIISLTNIFNESGNTTIDIPIGYMFGNNIFLGSTVAIPISVSNIATYNIKLNTTVEEYGINSSLVCVNLDFNFTFKAMIPLISNDMYVTNSVPLLTTVLYGEVPNYFFSGETPNVSIS